MDRQKNNRNSHAEDLLPSQQTALLPFLLFIKMQEHIKTNDTNMEYKNKKVDLDYKESSISPINFTPANILERNIKKTNSSELEQANEGKQGDHYFRKFSNLLGLQKIGYLFKKKEENNSSSTSTSSTSSTSSSSSSASPNLTKTNISPRIENMIFNPQ